MIFGKVKVRINLLRTRNNIYLILPYVRDALFKAKKEKKYDELWNRVTKAKTYDEAMKIIKKYAKIIDTSHEKVRRK